MAELRSYSLSALLPDPLHDALKAWSDRVAGATIDPVASHVTILVFESDRPVEEVTASVGEACAGIEPFEVHFSEVMQGPYWGKDDLDIVMLTRRLDDAAQVTLAALRTTILEALKPVLSGQPEPPPDGEYRPHLTLTTGLPPHEATRLAYEARDLEIRFQLRDIALWQQPLDRDDGPWDLLKMITLGRSA